MTEAARPIAMIPSDCFRWQPRVQFIDSFPTREAALTCAFEHGYNLIVERSEGKSVLFDVLDDPEEACTSGLNLELLKTEEVIVDPYTEGWTSLMLLTIWRFTRRLGTAVAGFYVSQIVPRFRQAASRRNRMALERTLRLAWKRLTRTSRAGVHRPFWHSPIPASCKVKTISLSAARLQARRIAISAAAFYNREVVPFCRSEICRYWWSNKAIALRREWRRYSQGAVTDIAKRLSAEASIFCSHQIVPFCQSAASRCWWSDHTIALRRGWYRYSQGSIIDTAKRLTAEASVLYGREVTPRLRYALTRCRQADIQGMGRQAWSTMLLTAIRLTDRFATSMAHFYAAEVSPRLHRAAARYQQADLEGTLRRSIEAVTPPQHSKSSQLG